MNTAKTEWWQQVGQAGDTYTRTHHSQKTQAVNHDIGAYAVTLGIEGGSMMQGGKPTHTTIYPTERQKKHNFLE